ncbi:MAG: N-acetylglucosamine-6-phosphate deacetylase [Verrucomicrobiales bacterium]|jgi:N-acetylglucosamine-6-phosphate deacetylase
MKNSPTVFRNGTLIFPQQLLESGAVVIEDGRITFAGPEADAEFPVDAEIIDAEGGFIAPGFVDLHVHGASGADFMDGTPDAVRTAIAGHTKFGTTTIFPTTTTGSPAHLERMLDACEAVQKTWNPGEHARLAGVHWYGPYFASSKVGAHPAGHERDPDPDEYTKAFDRESGIVKIATCAAELPGAEAFYRACADHGIFATCGHSNATFDEMQRGFDAGLRHVDHFWCAMSSTDSVRQRTEPPYQGSMAEFVLFEDEMSTEVLADGEHLAPELLKFALKFKGPERLCLVTDASRAVGMPPGEYLIGPLEAGEPLLSNGRVGVGLPPKTGLASTVKGMDHMIRVMYAQSGGRLPEVFRMATLTPAERVGMDDSIGSLEAGKLGDVQVLSRDLDVKRVFVQGVEFHP